MTVCRSKEVRHDHKHSADHREEENAKHDPYGY